MPREVKYWLCDHKCGRRAFKDKKTVEAHESRCWKNPALRTCLTCKFHEVVKDGCDHPEIGGCPSESWTYRSCNNPAISDPYNDLDPFKDLEPLEGEKLVRPIVGCEHHSL